MTSFHEDKLFKNVGNEDVKILLELMDVNTVKVKIWTKELRLLDPKDYVPDIILELDFENLIIELQSTPVDDEFSKRALTFVAVANRDKDNDKYMNLMVLSTAEESKTISYQFNKDSVFTYHVISLKDFNAQNIIESVESKIENGEDMEGREIVLYALVPLMVDCEIEKYIKKVVYNLLQLKNTTVSLKNLAYGIEWLIVDKFLQNREDRDIICDALGDRMSLLYEYGERKQKEGMDAGMEAGMEAGMQAGMEVGVKAGMKDILEKFIDGGLSISEISKKTDMSVKEINEILKG